MCMHSEPALGRAAFLLVAFCACPPGGEIIRLEAKDTLTAREMHQGDTLRFRLHDGP